MTHYGKLIFVREEKLGQFSSKMFTGQAELQEVAVFALPHPRLGAVAVAVVVVVVVVIVVVAAAVAGRVVAG